MACWARWRCWPVRKKPFAAGPSDDSSDTLGPSDASAFEVGGTVDATFDSQPEVAPADVRFDRQPEANYPVDVDTDHRQPEAGGSETGGDGRREVGLPTGFLSVTPASVNLGTFTLGQTATAILVVVNTGPTTSGKLVLSMSAGLSASGCAGALAPQASCSLVLTATPTMAGPFSGVIDISAIPGTGVPLQVLVSGVVSPAEQFAVSPYTIDLGTIAAGALSPPQTITVTALSTITDLTMGLSGPDVDKNASSTCVDVLTASASCTVVVNFKATSAGSKSDSVVFSAGGVTVVVPIIATVVNPAKLVVTPTTAMFATCANVPSTAVTIGVANAGDVATGTLSTTITGANAADFAIATNACSQLAPLGSCEITVVFTPSAASAAYETATLTVTDSGAGASMATVALDGSGGSSPWLAILSAQSDLGAVPVGATGAATVFTVANDGCAASGTLAVSVSSTEFVIAGDTCTGASLAGGGSCTVALSLMPATIGAKAAVLEVTNSSGNPAVKSVTGAGVSP